MLQTRGMGLKQVLDELCFKQGEWVLSRSWMNCASNKGNGS